MENEPSLPERTFALNRLAPPPARESLTNAPRTAAPVSAITRPSNCPAGAWARSHPLPTNSRPTPATKIGRRSQRNGCFIGLLTAFRSALSAERHLMYLKFPRLLLCRCACLGRVRALAGGVNA